MSKCIMIGCDLHQESTVLKIAEDRQAPETRKWKSTARDRKRMIDDLKRRAAAVGGARIVFAYEASSAGFGLYDQLQAAGIEAYVLAPTKIPRSSRQKRDKTDEKDALQILELVRAHVLAGNPLPSVWIPDPQLRDDREIVRLRLEVNDKITRLKVQVQSLLKRNSIVRPTGVGGSWTKAFRTWIKSLASEPSETGGAMLPTSTRHTLASLLRQLEFFEHEQDRLDQDIVILACDLRYVAAVQELAQMIGVGVLAAMVFLTEIGDLHRFANRRQLASYLGLAPTSYESGEADDRKGHISRQGSPRVRRILCQASWVRIRYDAEEKAAYERIKARNPKKAKIAIVAGMRRLGIRMWHAGQRVLPCRKTGKASATVRPRGAIGFSEASSGCPKESKEGQRPSKKPKCPGKSRSPSRGH
jgi:transposase